MDDLIKKFNETRSDLIFSEIYRKLEKDIKSKITYFKSKGFEEHDIIEGCDDALLECISKWDRDKSSFKTFFRKCADLRIIDARRKKRAQYSREVYEPDDFEEVSEGATFYDTETNIEELPNTENEFIETIKNIEQRQLFEEIIEKVDEQLRQQLLVIAGGRSANYAAQKFKMHHQTLNRKLSRLSRSYSERWQDLCFYA